MNPVGFYGLGCPEEEGWIGFLWRKAAPYAPAIGVVLGIAVASRMLRPDLVTFKRERSSDPRVREWLRSNRPPRSFKGTAIEWAFLNMPAGLVTGRPGAVL